MKDHQCKFDCIYEGLNGQKILACLMLGNISEKNREGDGFEKDLKE